MTSIILLNIVEMGVEGQWKESKHPTMALYYDVFNAVFSVFYVAEIVIGVIDQRLNFFCHGWNIMDSIVTLLGVVNLLIESEAHMGQSAIKMIRLLRLIRLVRVIKIMKSVPALRVVVFGLMKAINGIGWVILLLFLAIFIFSIIATETIDNDLFEIDFFSDTARSAITLLDIAIMAEWGSIIRPIMHSQPMLLPLFLLFLLISSFGMLNVMIGVIVDSTTESKRDMVLDERISKIQAASLTWHDRIHAKALSATDIRKSRTEVERLAKQKQREQATYDILQELIDDKDGIDFPSGLSPQDIYELLDFDAGGDLTHDEFIQGLERLLLGDAFQHTCLTMTLIGKLRRERVVSDEYQNRLLKQILEQQGAAEIPMPGNGSSKSEETAELRAGLQGLIQENSKQLSSRIDEISGVLQGLTASETKKPSGDETFLVHKRIDGLDKRFDQMESHFAALTDQLKVLQGSLVGHTANQLGSPRAPHYGLGRT